MTHPVVVVDYDPAWPVLFDEIQAPVRATLGELVITIEHVGSTSVPGLAAKPIIDLDVVIPSRADLPEAIRRLANLGYVHRGDLGIPGREAFARPPGTPAHHLYVCTPDTPNYLEHLALRDYLRAHPDAAREYGDLKRRLAMAYRYDIDSYVDAKTEFITNILRLAGADTTKGA